MADIFTMKDGRKVTVNFLDVKSILKVSKKDWKEINVILKEAIEFVQSPKYMDNLRKSLCLPPKPSSENKNNNNNECKKTLKDWQKWEDCMLSFLRSHRGLRTKFNDHVEEWNKIEKLPKSAYERDNKK